MVREGVVIRYLHAGHVSAAKIHRHLVEVYGEGVMSHQRVTKWCKDLKSS